MTDGPTDPKNNPMAGRCQRALAFCNNVIADVWACRATVSTTQPAQQILLIPAFTANASCFEASESGRGDSLNRHPRNVIV